MVRNRSFYTLSHEPLRQDPCLSLHQSTITGPFSFLNPTRARFNHVAISHDNDDDEKTQDADPASDPSPKRDQPKASPVTFQWRSRDNRKGRHTLVVQQSSATTASDDVPCILPESTATLKATLRGILRMLTYYPYWDISWLVAVIFTLGSAIWCINAFFV